MRQASHWRVVALQAETIQIRAGIPTMGRNRLRHGTVSTATTAEGARAMDGRRAANCWRGQRGPTGMDG